MPVQEDKSYHFQAGAQFHFLVKELTVWCYNESYPGVIEVDCKDLSPQLSIKIGDIEKMLPPGMFLHKQCQKMRFQSIVKLTETNSYIQRKNQVIEQAELIREERRKIQKRLLNKNDGKQKRTTGLVAPKYIASSKHIMAEKKQAQGNIGGKEK